jgi:hypothetical protein
VQLAPAAIQRLFEVLAPITNRDRLGRDGVATAHYYRSDTVHALLTALSSNPSAEAKAALLALHQNPLPRAWHDDIHYSQRTQAANAREASFRVPSAHEAALALAGGAPVHPADLRALVMDHLIDAVSEWRGQNTFSLKLFWRDEEGRKTPKIENECRDLLLERLKERLKPQNIHVGRECSAAQDKRVDMCAEFLHDGQRTALPIEVKKEDHEKLWTAWRHQLKKLYTIDPDAQGFGLYLVLWFGKKTAIHPEGFKPVTPDQLRQGIERLIPAESRHRLAVQVLDLSWPGAA